MEEARSRYPADLARFITAHWPDDAAREEYAGARAALLDVAYQASLQREEGRLIRLRLILSGASWISKCAASSDLCLPFDQPRSFNTDELRRLALAAPFEASMVGVEAGEDGKLRIWGLLWTGAHWLAPTWGGRATSSTQAGRMIVHVSGPGRLSVYAGHQFVAALESGRLLDLTTDVFSSCWLPRLFAHVRAELVERHEREKEPGAASLDDSLVRSISQQMLRRTLWLMRASHHGGTLLFADPADLEALIRADLRIKYRFAPGDAQSRYRKLLAEITSGLAVKQAGRAAITAEDFFREHADVESAIFELSRVVASLAQVDGAVLLSKRFELIAFGAEVLADHEPIGTVFRALDTEGLQRVADTEESVGTRHRAAYRFIRAHPDAVAVVVSQDGVVRFVAAIAGDVTYFEQHVTG